MTDPTTLTCSCGKVHIDIQHAPIMVSECHCTSCRQASERLGHLPGAPDVRAENGGTPYVLYRKDRVRITSGQDMIREFRLKPESPTRRIVASCCNTPLFLEFQHGHWLSIFSVLWPEETRPPAEMRTMTSDIPDGVTLDTSIPNARTQSLSFMRKLLGAWIAMGFRSPKLEINGQINA